jgi:uncharacterized membrane protein YphA (DoxX/SURF4 family)
MNTDRPGPTPTQYGLSLLRVVLAIVVAGRALENLVHLRVLQAEMITVGVPQAEISAALIVALEFAVCLSLLMGRYVRLAALGALLDACVAVAMIGLQHRALELHIRLESAALVAAAAVFCSLQRAVDPQ